VGFLRIEKGRRGRRRRSDWGFKNGVLMMNFHGD
jgi:hypothetical protein